MVLLSARGNCRGSNERVRSNAVGVLFSVSLVRDGQTIVDTLERLGWVGLGWAGLVLGENRAGFDDAD